MILLLDNKDSFVWNLAQALQTLGAEVAVVRSDRLDVAAAGRCDALVISPGPGRPEDAGIAIAAIRRWSGARPILGVCLGHQAVGQAFGASVVRGPEPMHGKTSDIRHDGRTVFAGIENPMGATRYHSLIVTDIPDELEVSAWCDEDIVMGLRHRTLPIEGVQFHPESILTTSGRAMLTNFLEMTA